MTFSEAQHRLLVELRTQIHNGHLTERGMARLTGVSQPHIHNVLKGVRNLSPQIADRLLKTFHLTLLDLSSPEELSQRAQTVRRLALVDLPVMESVVGLKALWLPEALTREWLALPVPTQCIGPRLAAVRLKIDPRMEEALGASDLAVVNTSERAMFPPDSAGLYVVQTVSGTAVRYVRWGSSHLYFATADALDSPTEWENAPRAEQIVHGRLVWIGCEKDIHLPMHRRGRVLGESGVK